MTEKEAMKIQYTAMSNIRWISKQQGRNLKDLEKYCGVTQGYFSRCRETRRRISLVLVLMAVDFLGVTISELLDTDLVKQSELDDINSQIAELQERKNKLMKGGVYGDT